MDVDEGAVGDTDTPGDVLSTYLNITVTGVYQTQNKNEEHKI